MEEMSCHKRNVYATKETLLPQRRCYALEELFKLWKRYLEAMEKFMSPPWTAQVCEPVPRRFPQTHVPSAHESGGTGGARVHVLRWQVPAKDRSSSQLHLWYSKKIETLRMLEGWIRKKTLCHSAVSGTPANFISFDKTITNLFRLLSYSLLCSSIALERL